MKNLMNLKGAQILSKKEQQSINGGAGPYSIQCTDGVWINEVPNLSSSNTSWACINHGSYSGNYFCFGPECPGEN